MAFDDNLNIQGVKCTSSLQYRYHVQSLSESQKRVRMFFQLRSLSLMVCSSTNGEKDHRSKRKKKILFSKGSENTTEQNISIRPEALHSLQKSEWRNFQL